MMTNLSFSLCTEWPRTRNIRVGFVYLMARLARHWMEERGILELGLCIW